ncbi:MAG TPA: tRNA-dihydrouridine synthase family protein [Bacilli bacterium]|nr:tRNA-dihydrouridine synthase family protein [Bacilli bacterium]
MFKIGDITIDGPVILAPMAGITTRAYRDFMRSFGVNLSYTEMISDSGLIFQNERTFTYLPDKDEERPLSVQLFGGEVNKLLGAVEKIENYTSNYDFLDLNLGCPVPKVTRNNGGSAWLKYPEELILMVGEVVKKSKKPVTVKIRIGWDEKQINFKELLPRLEKAGVAAIAIHLRTTKQLYSGKARYDLAENISELVKIPLIVSGDIYTLDDAINALNITGAKAVMIARGQLGNPFLATQIVEYYKSGKRLEGPTVLEQLAYLETLAKALIAEKGEKRAILTMRTLAPHFVKNYAFAKKHRIQLNSKISTYSELKSIIETIKNDFLLIKANSGSI